MSRFFAYRPTLALFIWDPGAVNLDEMRTNKKVAYFYIQINGGP